MFARPRPRRPAPTVGHVVAGIAAAVIVAACSGPPAATATDPDADRATAVVQAREQVVEPAQALGTAAARVATQLEVLVEGPDEEAVDAVTTAVADLADARDTVADLELDTDTEDVRAAAEALDAAAEAATVLGEAATTTTVAAARAAEADEVLATLVAAWNEPGSYSQLLARFDENRQQATDLAADLDGQVVEGCPGPVASRAAAATVVAVATAELRGLVERREGEAFDARRAELDEVPLGRTDDGDPRTIGAPIDPDECPAVEEATDAARDVATALEDLQDALNPADLT